MQTQAILFGSIGTMAETSELQRTAFNRAFAEAGLDWQWSEDEYTRLLERPGGLTRIEDYNRARGAKIDASAIHERKTRLFQEALAEGVDLRPGVAETIAAAHKAGVPVGICATTDPATVDLILTRARPGLPAGAIAFRGDASSVERSKPAPDIWQLALERLGLSPEGVIAIEDSPENAASAAAAGLTVIGFPGARHAHRSFPAARETVERLTPDILGPGPDGTLGYAAE
ncbi:MAG: HAD family hydrolase [Hasllibacter sp.]